MPLTFVEPKFVVRNISGWNLTILGVVSLIPLEEVDLFALTDIVSKTTIMNELRPPLGKLYIDINVRKVLQIIDLQFFTLNSVGLTSKGDLLTHDGYDGQLRFAVGPDGYVLTADSSTETGLKWGVASGGTSDHGSLIGLGDDDHTQYILTTGARAFSGAAQLPEIATPSTPSSGLGKVYFKTDGKLYALNDAGVETDLQATGGAISIGGGISGGTTGSVLFVGSGATIAQDNANIFWDDSNNRLGIGTASPQHSLHISGNMRADGYVELAEIAAPDTPASGYGRLYAKTDGLLYFKNDAGTEYDLTAGGGITGSGTANRMTFWTGASSVSYDDALRWDGTTLTIDGYLQMDGGTLSGASLAINSQTGTTYTIQQSDNGKTVTLSNASAITVAVPAGLTPGFNCICVQLGAGQVTFSTSGTTINNRQGHTKIAGQYGAATLVSYASNIFVLSGDTAA
jgi:hypothetical protein